MAKKAKPANGEAEAKPKGRRAKQGFLPDMEPPSIPEIDAAADAYVDARNTRMAMTETEVERRTLLMGLMKQHKLANYEYDGKTVSIVADEKCKVKTKKEGEEGGEDE